jgi:hypothetical protein
LARIKSYVDELLRQTRGAKHRTSSAGCTARSSRRSMMPTGGALRALPTRTTNGRPKGDYDPRLGRR